MFINVLYVILAVLGLSFLVFIHELGHYYMARRLRMKVETFSIGFGKPIYAWMRDGVHWQIGWLPFGGYVKIAGMDQQESPSNYSPVEESFFSKPPLDRIKVAFMGPFVNIVFALLVFTALWGIGGREKKFVEYTHKIGWIDPKSELYAKGVRPGDEIISYDNHAYKSAKDHLYRLLTASEKIEVKVNRANPYTGKKEVFTYTVKPYSHPQSTAREIMTAGILQPASYVIYDQINNKTENSLPEGSPMLGSGIKYGDRIIWVDGQLIYSLTQQSEILNDSRALLTIERGNKVLLRRVPRVLIEELRLDSEVREELMDWQFEAHLNTTKFQKIFTIPYNLNNDGVVEAAIKFIDEEREEEAFPTQPFSELEQPLEPDDKILAVDGFPVEHSYEILAQLQKRHVNIIVQRDPKIQTIPDWNEADQVFDQQFDRKDLRRLEAQVGLSTPMIRSSGNLYLLKPVTPKKRSDLKLSVENQDLLATEKESQRKEIEKNIGDPEKRAQALQILESQDQELILGLTGIKDQKILYNPDPFTLFSQVFQEIWEMLQALFTGSLNPKWMAGPVGIIQVVHQNAMNSIKEALYWLGAISLNLGVLNLLPLPVLDGGSIAFALYEISTGRRLKAKTLEKLIIPFALLLIALFVYLTYQDLVRLFTTLFR
jgi:regulator of sigma E protease